MKLWRLILACWLFCSAPHVSMACSCLRPSVTESVQGADIVFRGELIAHRFDRAVFRVDERWKGNLYSEVEVQWRDGTRGDCDGFGWDQLKMGNKLLVFAVRNRDGLYHTHICFPTKLVTEAQSELQELGPGTPPRAGVEKADSRLWVWFVAVAAVAFGVFFYRKRQRTGVSAPHNLP